MTEPQLKVLVIDDQAPVVEALGVLFDLHAIPWVSAPDPDRALAAIDSQPVGVVLQDMNFSPGQVSGDEGISLFRRLRAEHPDLPVLLLTAWASLETAVQLVKEGADDYIAKPWDDAKLVATVRSLLRLRALQLENARLFAERRGAREEIRGRYDLCGAIHESEPMHRAIALAAHVASSDAPVLVTGPSGCGKEKIAEIIQANSRRAQRPFLKVNLGALPHDLIESELFGAEAGAYTGASRLRTGRFEAADGGTLFLDEIDSLTPAGQVKLLRVLQSGEFQRLGSSTTRRADVRVISATNADLKPAIAAGGFREDLYFRLNVVEIAVPPLRERPEDILPLARHFLERTALERGGASRELGQEAVRALLAHSWEGNVRELQNRVQRAMLVSEGPLLSAADLGLEVGDEKPRATLSTPDDLHERRQVEQALLDARGVVARAAEELGVSRQALYRKMVRLGIVLERRPRV